MNELGFWTRRIKPMMHRPESGRCAWKVGTSTRAGIPDVAWTRGPVGGMLELKYVDAWPVRASTPIRVGTSMEQHAHLTQWAQAGGLAHVLLGMPDPETGKSGALGFLLPPGHPDPIPRDQLPPPVDLRYMEALYGALTGL